MTTKVYFIFIFSYKKLKIKSKKKHINILKTLKLKVALKSLPTDRAVNLIAFDDKNSASM